MKFNLGRVVQTATVASRIAESKEFAQFVSASIRRYVDCDWGDMCQEDKVANDDAVKNWDRIFAAYVDKHGTKIYIITDCDRAYTTVLFPDEY